MADSQAVDADLEPVRIKRRLRQGRQVDGQRLVDDEVHLESATLPVGEIELAVAGVDQRSFDHLLNDFNGRRRSRADHH